VASAGQALVQSLCGHLDQLQDTLTQLQASPAPDVSEAVATLGQISTDLQTDAQQLSGQGQGDLAAVATGVSTAADTLAMVLQEQGNVPAAWQAGIAAVSAALQQAPAEMCGTAST
jgi:hypothetical protein